MPLLHGLVLAAGGGRRFGGPKALARAADGTPWVALAVDVLRAAGCGPVTVVLGAGAAEARALVPGDARIVVAERWDRGLGASLAAGLDTVAGGEAALVTLVDLPGLPAEAARRVASAPGLRRAVVAGRRSHPVQIPAEHLRPLAASLHGDDGARAYLAAHGVAPVEVGDLWDGADVDDQPARSSDRAVTAMKSSGTTR